MGSAYIPGQSVVDIYVGKSYTIDPVVVIVVNGIAYPNGYRIDYAGGFRNFCGAYDSTTGSIYVRCHTIAYGEDLPAFTLTNTEVLTIGKPLPSPVGNPSILNVTGRFDDGYYMVDMLFTHVYGAIGYNVYFRPQSDTTGIWTLLIKLRDGDIPTRGQGTALSYLIYDDGFVDYTYNYKYKLVAVGADGEEYGVGYYG